MEGKGPFRIYDPGGTQESAREPSSAEPPQPPDCPTGRPVQPESSEGSSEFEVVNMDEKGACGEDKSVTVGMTGGTELGQFRFISQQQVIEACS
ncbi:hypothetical protein JZ751_020108 [Albula glossodonta]|uniref:Uncharacterized protein n=1 Tax=Albula glossodonta TaxID=121402 RepID=A0A8T2NKK1_9TELE|nr:hypothetical protein JZ751_020108 [Albula glossodonta]